RGIVTHALSSGCSGSGDSPSTRTRSASYDAPLATDPPERTKFSGSHRCQPVPVHDLRESRMVRRAACSGGEHGGGLPEVVDADRGWRDDAENFRIAAPSVVESVDGAAGNAERIARPDLDLDTVDS